MRHMLFIWGVVLASGVVWAAMVSVFGITAVPAFVIGMAIGAGSAALATKYVDPCA